MRNHLLNAALVSLEVGDLAYKIFAMALDKNPTTREFYDSDTGKYLRVYIGY